MKWKFNSIFAYFWVEISRIEFFVSCEFSSGKNFFAWHLISLGCLGRRVKDEIRMEGRARGSFGECPIATPLKISITWKVKVQFCFLGRFIISALEEIRCSKGEDHLVLVAWSGRDGGPRVPRVIQATLNRKKQHFLRFDSMTDDEEMFFEALRTALF